MKPTIYEASFSIGQSKDGTGGNAETMTITVTTEGAGPYVVLNTRSWSLDTGDELKVLIDDLLRRCEGLIE